MLFLFYYYCGDYLGYFIILTSIPAFLVFFPILTKEDVTLEDWILIIVICLWKAGWRLMRHRKYENVPSGPGVQLSPRHELLCN